MEDIAPELLASLRKSFAERIEQSSIIDSLYKRIESGSASHEEAEDFAYEVGKCLSETFKSGLSSAVLPDGKMYYNIADRVIRPLLSDDHTIVSDAAAMVQKSMNEKAGIGMKVQKPKINEDRVAGIIDKVSDADQYDDVAWVLDAPVVNFSQSVVDDMLKSNVEFHGKAGLTPKIIRKAERKCCKWCKGLAGEYEYPDVPHDVYRRHENCRCTVLYDPADGSKKRQNVHSKEWTDPQKRDKINKRKSIAQPDKKRVSSQMFRSQGDPMREVFGSAEESHPNQIEMFRKEIAECKAELVEHDREALGYSPAIMAGHPGVVYISKGASYSAWCHEMQHLREDRDAGWRGMRILMDLDERYASEQRAYAIEIAMAREANREDIANRLLANLEEERRKIYGD